MEAIDFQEPARTQKTPQRTSKAGSPLAAQSGDPALPAMRQRVKSSPRANPLDEDARVLFARLDQAFAGFATDTATCQPGSEIHTA